MWILLTGAAKWLLGNPWRIAIVVGAVLLGGLYAQNLYYSARIDSLKAKVIAMTEQRDQYRQAAKDAIESAQRQNAAIDALRTAADKRATDARIALEQAKGERLALEAEVERIRNLPQAVPGDACASACALLRRAP